MHSFGKVNKVLHGIAMHESKTSHENFNNTKIYMLIGLVGSDPIIAIKTSFSAFFFFLIVECNKYLQVCIF